VTWWHPAATHRRVSAARASTQRQRSPSLGLSRHLRGTRPAAEVVRRASSARDRRQHEDEPTHPHGVIVGHHPLEVESARRSPSANITTSYGCRASISLVHASQKGVCSPVPARISACNRSLSVLKTTAVSEKVVELKSFSLSAMKDWIPTATSWGRVESILDDAPHPTMAARRTWMMPVGRHHRRRARSTPRRARDRRDSQGSTRGHPRRSDPRGTRWRVRPRPARLRRARRARPRGPSWSGPGPPPTRPPR
jgi:hypothetical protein